MMGMRWKKNKWNETKEGNTYTKNPQKGKTCIQFESKTITNTKDEKINVRWRN